ncbi:hypothetical protein ANANG_G00000990 [Anguilla anguilla]|uniref:Uncharacterized protein n=1 Tax=Anguilla anguilla TaxID=7936 RepID=A0A9D3MYV7_ANGAN|nr:hypothetical protein ANANG_G00000990 [Anguilla anguilla]
MEWRPAPAWGCGKLRPGRRRLHVCLLRVTDIIQADGSLPMDPLRGGGGGLGCAVFSFPALFLEIVDLLVDCFRRDAGRFWDTPVFCAWRTGLGQAVGRA